MPGELVEIPPLGDALHGAWPPNPLRVLIVEDSPADAELLCRELKRTGLTLDARVVDNEPDFLAALDRSLDIILSDYSLPRFSGLRALELAKASRLDVPFVLISGTIGEEVAVAAMHAGAEDYLMKGKLARLETTVQRALERRRIRGEQRRSQAEIERLADIVRKSNDAIFSRNLDGVVTSWNAGAERLFGYGADEAIGKPIADLILPQEIRTRVARNVEDLRRGESVTPYETQRLTKSGRIIHVLSSASPTTNEAGEVTGASVILRDISELKRAEEALRESEHRKSAILESALDCIVTIDHAGKIVEFNRAAEATFGFARDQVLGKSMVELIVPPRLRAAHRRGFARYLATGEGRVLGKRLELEAIRADGTEFPIELAITAIKAGATPLFTAFIRDITERRNSETKIGRLNRVHAVLSGINAAIVRIRDRQELFEEACRIAVESGRFRMAWLGMVDKDLMQVTPVARAGEVGDFFESAPLAILETKPGGHGLAGRAIRDMKPVISNDVRKDPQKLMTKELETRGINSVAVIPLIVSGAAAGVLALYSADVGFFDDEELHLLLELAGDISFALDHIEKANRLEYLAYYDPLTGLANRRLFLERLEQKLLAASRGQRKLAASVVDIERFKAINDAFGRQAGDELLRQIAERIKSSGPDPSHVARIGADHFAMVSADLESEDDVGRRTEQRLDACFASPFQVAGQDFRISARVGVAMFPGDGDNAEMLFANAEAALKKAKASGERYLFFAPTMTARIRETLSLENKLREALEKEEFVLHYQPKVTLENRSIVGLEALIRWQSAEFGLVPPGQFIPLLEATGLICAVGAWALRRASVDRRMLAAQGLSPLRIAVNVSPLQLRQRDFVEILERAISEEVSPAGIDLEITESLIMEDIKANIGKLEAVRALGVEVAVDDFGTGYSSLRYLAKLPIGSLKIDRSFIVDMLSDSNATTIVSTIISLAHSLGLKVVAEGVETEEQANLLRLMRCDQMQGFLFSKPLRQDELVGLLQKSA